MEYCRKRGFQNVFFLKRAYYFSLNLPLFQKTMVSRKWLVYARWRTTPPKPRTQKTGPRRNDGGAQATGIRRKFDDALRAAELAITPRVGRRVDARPILGLCDWRYLMINGPRIRGAPASQPQSLPRLRRTKRPRVSGDIRRKRSGARIPPGSM